MYFFSNTEIFENNEQYIYIHTIRLAYNTNTP